MLVKLAGKNIRYYARSYFVYLLTIAFSTWVYYMFSSLVAGEQMQSLAGGSKVYGVCFSIGAWMILLFTAVFIWYSTDFFFQKRKQEFGLYLLMGIEKGRVALLLLTETVILGMAATVGGVLLGIVTHLPVQKAIASFLHTQSAVVTWPTLPEIARMLLRFFVVFLALGAMKVRTVGKSELAELFHAQDTQEAPTKASWVRLILSAAVLATGYGMIFQVKGAANLYLLPMGLGCVLAGTFLTFLQCMAMAVHLLRGTERCASDFSARISITGLNRAIRRNAASWATVSLLVAASMSAVILAYSAYQLEVSLAAVAGEETEIVLGIFRTLMLVMALSASSFLASTGSMLYFHELSDMQENERNYRLLYCLGADQAEMNRVAQSQCWITFLIPLLAGVGHTVLFAAYIHARNLLDGITPVLLSAALCVVIYCLYYLLALRQSKKLMRTACESKT